MLRKAVTRIWNKTKFRKPEDFIFATKNGTPTERRNVLRHVKTAAKELKLPKEVDFRSFRTMHASLMHRTGARAEITRDNMGHSEVPTTIEIYSKTWWDERAAAMSAVVDLVMKSDESKAGQDNQQKEEQQPQMLFVNSNSGELEPQVEPLHQ